MEAQQRAMRDFSFSKKLFKFFFFYFATLFEFQFIQRQYQNYTASVVLAAV